MPNTFLRLFKGTKLGCAGLFFSAEKEKYGQLQNISMTERMARPAIEAKAREQQLYLFRQDRRKPESRTRMTMKTNIRARTNPITGISGKELSWRK
jgi:hypothetical protein